MPKDFTYKELGVLEADELVEALNFPNGQLCRSSSREKYSTLAVFKSTRAWFEGSYHRTAIIWLMRVPRPCSKSKGSKMIPSFQNLCRELWCANSTHALRAHPALEGTDCSAKPYPYGSVSDLLY